MPPGYQSRKTPSYCCDTILRHVFSAIPDLLTVIDRDFNIIMTNWHDSGVVPEEARRGRPKCYRVYHHRDRPCENCHVQKVFATGQPQKAEKINVLDGRTREFSAFPVLSESGQVILGAEHVRDVTEPRLAEEALRRAKRPCGFSLQMPRSLFSDGYTGYFPGGQREGVRPAVSQDELIGGIFSPGHCWMTGQHRGRPELLL